jgi:excisionase family DNA binding protein
MLPLKLYIDTSSEAYTYLVHAFLDALRTEEAHRLRLSSSKEPGQPAKLLLRTKEAAYLLGTSTSEIYRLLQTGTLPSIKVGKRRRIAYKDLLSFIESQRSYEYWK